MHLFYKTLSVTLITLAYASVPAHASPQDDLVFGVQEYTHDKHPGWVIEKLVTLKVGDKCWAKIADKKNSALGKLAGDARYIVRYAKAVTGDDWAAIENQSTGTKEANRAIVEKMVGEFAPKFHLTLTIEGDDCEAGNGLWLHYLSNTTLALGKFPPKSGKMMVTINVTSKTKDVKAEVGKDGSSLTVTGPRDIEPHAWADTIENALKRVSSKG